MSSYSSSDEDDDDRRASNMKQLVKVTRSTLDNYFQNYITAAAERAERCLPHGHPRLRLSSKYRVFATSFFHSFLLNSLSTIFFKQLSFPSNLFAFKHI